MENGNTRRPVCLASKGSWEMSSNGWTRRTSGSRTAGCFFSGGPDLLARANIGSRYAERIQVHLGSFQAVSFEELFQGSPALPWENWIGKKDAFPVKGWSLNSALHSVPDCQSIIKKAIVERLKSVYGLSWFEESGAVVQVQFTLLRTRRPCCSIPAGPAFINVGIARMPEALPLRKPWPPPWWI